MASPLTIAHYKITSELGKGGMGEVWRATDTKLNREVAIKVLPQAFAQDPDRMARFMREAQVLASLNHPNIGAIYGVEERALVLELVEGPMLADRIAQGPLALSETIQLATQIAAALEYAHERGIVHRDLKPANVKITPDGCVKLLDFGLAKALSDDTAAPDPASSPTLTIAATRAGTFLGTAAYMAPEQARGQSVDKRADIWAFGVVLYEMLTGRRLFEGDTVSDTLAAVLRADLDWSGLPAEVPPNIRRLLRRCVERDRKYRLRDIGDARLELDAPGADQTGPPSVVAPRKSGRLAWIVAGVMALAAIGITGVHLREPHVVAPVVKFAVAPPEKGGFNAWLALSPDGRYLGFTATDKNGTARVWLRSLDSLELRPLTGTEGSVTFFWSPDSHYVAFQSAGKLKKIDISGGPPQTLCDGVGVLLGGSWNHDGVILYGSNNGPIMRVPAAGGVPMPVTKLEQKRSETNHTDPIFLPDGRRFLYLRRSSQPDNIGVYAGSLDAVPDQQVLKRIQLTEFSFAYAPPQPLGRAVSKHGYLLFLRDDNLVAQPFDESRLETAGEPVPITEQVGTSITRAFVAVSTNGVLAYRNGTGGATLLTWYDREGHKAGDAAPAGRYEDVALSPDGSSIAFDQPSPGGNRQIWMLQLARGANTRLSFLPDGARSPVWSSDRKQIAFSAARGPTIYVKDSESSSREQPVMKAGGTKFVTDWSRDGRYLLYTETATSLDILALPDPLSAGEHKLIPVAASGFNETHGRFSPDGRWVAYASDESGKYEIYVRPFPPTPNDGKWLVSSSGGIQPKWRADGKELYYLETDQKLMAVSIDANSGGSFHSMTPHELFPTPTAAIASNVLSRYDVTRDGKRFLLLDIARGEQSAAATVVLNWYGALNK